MRYELKCNYCGKTIGFVSMNIPVENISVIMNIKDSQGVNPICCPECETKKKNQRVTLRRI